MSADPIEYGCFVKVMQGRREVQEDRHVIIEDLSLYFDSIGLKNIVIPPEFKPAVFLGLFDGHMGSQASTFCSRQLPIEVGKELGALPLFNTVPIIHTIVSSTSVNVDSTLSHSISDVTSVCKRRKLSHYTESNQCNNEDNTVENSTPYSLGSIDPLYTERDITAVLQQDQCIELNPSLNCQNDVTEENHLVTKEEASPIDSCVSQCCSNSTDLNIDDIGNVLKRAFASTDKQFLDKYRLNKEGTTATVALLLGKHLFLSWVGDSKAVLGSLRHVQFSPILKEETKEEEKIISKTVIEENPIVIQGKTIHLTTGQWITSSLSSDHKPSRLDERERILAAGGVVLKLGGIYRVARGDFESECRRIKQANCLMGSSGQRHPVALAVSRAMGDRQFKDSGKPPIVSSIPDIHYLELNPEQDKLIILGCDGIWDVLREQETVSLMQSLDNSENSGFEAGASAIVKLAFQKGSEDNLTAIVVRISTTPIIHSALSL